MNAPDDFWSRLDPATAAAFREQATPCTYARGRQLCHEHQVPDRVFLLRSGHVKVVSYTPTTGRELVLAYRGPGDLVGEFSALDGDPRSATIEAIEPVEALVLSHIAFRAFLVDHPDAALVLLGSLTKRLREATAHQVQFSTFTTMGRVAAHLLELTDRFGLQENGRIRIALPLTQEELAGWTGSSIVSVGRALHTMRDLRCIETRRREYHVLNRRGLEALRIE